MIFPALAIALGLLIVARKKNPDTEPAPVPPAKLREKVVEKLPEKRSEKLAEKPAISSAPPVVEKGNDPAPPDPAPQPLEKESDNGREKVS